MILPDRCVLLRSLLYTQSNHPQEPQEEAHDPQFEPVIKLTEQVEAKTHEEDEEVLFKMSAFLAK